MTSIFTHRPSDRPPRSEDLTAGATMSVIAHAVLIAALVWGVHWKSQSEPEGVTAELWSAVPQFAAPAPTSPPPQPETRPQPAPVPPPPVPTPTPPAPPPVATPKPPDIATELDKMHKQEEKLKAAQQEKADKLKAAQQQKLEADKLAKLHDDYLKRALGQLDAPPNATGTAARTSGPSSTWAGKVAALIRSHLIWTDALDGLQPPEVRITLGVDGSILSSQIVKSSGNPRFDAAVKDALTATQTLPRDVDGRIPSSVIIVFNPRG